MDESRGPSPGRLTVWHDLECGGYDHDLGVWRQLAAEHGAPILDVGAGTGRVSLDLARAGHEVFAVDVEPELIGELRRRGAELPVTAEVADARTMSLGRRFALCIVPMQTIQLLGGSDGRTAFFATVREHLRPGGVVAAAIAEELEIFDVTDGAFGPLPDVTEIGGVVYSSLPTAVREHDGGYVLERRRDVVAPDGDLQSERDLIHLDRVSAAELEGEAVGVGLRAAGRTIVPATAEYTGSTVVMLGA